MPIPFVRKFPNNKAMMQDVERPGHVEDQAIRFLKSGGWYTTEILPNGMVHLAVTDSELNEIYAIESVNDERLPLAIDMLVQHSQEFIHPLTGPRIGH